MNGLPPVSTRTVTLFPYPTLFRSTLAEWPLELIPDSPPEVTFLSAPQRTERAALRLNYQAKDDYGLAEVKAVVRRLDQPERSEEHTSELQSLMRISYAVFCLKKNTTTHTNSLHEYTLNQHDE